VVVTKEQKSLLRDLALFVTVIAVGLWLRSITSESFQRVGRTIFLVGFVVLAVVGGGYLLVSWVIEHNPLGGGKLYEGENICAACGQPLVTEEFKRWFAEKLRAMPTAEELNRALEAAPGRVGVVQKITIHTFWVGTGHIHSGQTFQFHEACYGRGKTEVQKEYQIYKARGGIMSVDWDPKDPSAGW
jgi:hypothetical protein